VEGARFEATFERLFFHSRGDHDHRHVGPAAMHFLDEPETAAAGHAQVRHDERGQPLLEQFDRLLGRRRRLAFEAKGASGPHQDIERRRLVIDNRDGPLIEMAVRVHRNTPRSVIPSWRCRSDGRQPMRCAGFVNRRSVSLPDRQKAPQAKKRNLRQARDNRHADTGASAPTGTGGLQAYPASSRLALLPPRLGHCGVRLAVEPPDQHQCRRHAGADQQRTG